MSVEVTVGMPVYNNAATLRRSVESLLNQTIPPRSIIISDDASTDSTGDIGRALASQNPGVRYVRQTSNLGPAGNFGFVLNLADTPFFMWLAGDDYIHPDYISRTAAVLASNPDVVSCVSDVLFVRPDGSSRIAPGTYPLMRDRISNLALYLSDPTDNSRLFGLHRTQVVQASFPRSDFLIGYDWAVMAATLMHGKHARVPEVLMIRDETPSESYFRMIRRYYRFRLLRGVPLARMSWDLLWRAHLPWEGPVIRALLAANLMMHIDYMRQYHPGYARISAFLERNILWRLRTCRDPD